MSSISHLNQLSSNYFSETSSRALELGSKVSIEVLDQCHKISSTVQNFFEGLIYNQCSHSFYGIDLDSCKIVLYEGYSSFSAAGGGLLAGEIILALTESKKVGWLKTKSAVAAFIMLFISTINEGRAEKYACLFVVVAITSVIYQISQIEEFKNKILTN